MGDFPLPALAYAALVAVCVAVALIGGTASAAEQHTFYAAGGHFLLDGKPFQVISGEMHYPRIPRAYWRTRLRMAKAMGLNTITTYVFWNEHEPQPGVYDFSGNNDVAEFIREAQEEGLYVILRPGPYVCAEWDFGGFPAWLLRDAKGDHSMVVRSSDPSFIAAATRWMERLGKELAPLQVGNGGPIILVQVENEYGTFGSDHSYMEQIRKMIVGAGFTSAQLYTADGPEQLPNGALPGIPAFVNFGPGDARKAFAALATFRPGQVWMSTEYWAGWFDHWGGEHAHTDAQQQAAELGWMLRQGASVSIYMFHGGTSFGWMNGANSNGKDYEPDVTSYDYDAPLDESGRPTPKYFLFRNAISQATGAAPPPVPPISSPITIPAFSLKQSLSLWAALPVPIHGAVPVSMEDAGQAYGYILYRTTLRGPARGNLVLDQLHDYAKVYLDGTPVGTLDRRLGQNTLPLRVSAQRARLDLLVENTGRVNFGPALRDARAGITHTVTFGDRPVTEWDIFPLPMRSPGKLSYSDSPCTGPCFYRATFQLGRQADTFLDTSAFTKGEVWLNGHALGRMWTIGPQKALYAPGPWLNAGTNEVIVFDLDGAPGRSLQGLDHPELNGR